MQPYTRPITPSVRTAATRIVIIIVRLNCWLSPLLLMSFPTDLDAIRGRRGQSSCASGTCNQIVDMDSGREDRRWKSSGIVDLSTQLRKFSLLYFVMFTVRGLLSLTPSRLFLVVRFGFCSSSSDLPISSFCPRLPLFLCVSKVLGLCFGCGLAAPSQSNYPLTKFPNYSMPKHSKVHRTFKRRIVGR